MTIRVFLLEKFYLNDKKALAFSLTELASALMKRDYISGDGVSDRHDADAAGQGGGI